MIKSKSDLRYYIREDAKNNSMQNKYGKITYRVLNYVIPWGGVNPIWNFILTMRRLEYYTNCPSPWNQIMRLYTKYKYRKLSMRLGFSIPINTFGPGVSIPHYGTIVINPNAKIGSNCRIHVGTNIGMHRGGAPIIGDNVYIGPGAILFGGIKVANNVSIGANTIVNKDIEEENVVVGGTLSSIVKHNSQPWNHGK